MAKEKETKKIIMKYVKVTKERWVHTSYKKAYCFRYRNGMVYTCIDSIRQATGYEWKQENRRICLQLLDERLYGTKNKTEFKIQRTILDLVKQFHKDIVLKLQPSTQMQYKIVYKQFLNESILLDEIQNIREMILDKKNKFIGSNNTIWKRLQRVSKIFDYGVDLEWIEKNPIPKSMIPKYVDKEIITTTQENIKLLINHFNNNNQNEMALIIEFASITGMRIQEIIDLTWTNISDDRIDFTGKGKRKRTFPIKPFPRLKIIFKKLKSMNDKYVFSWRNQQNPARLLREALIKLRKEYPKLNWDITFHIIRKTTLNIWMNKGVPEKASLSAAGHNKDVAYKNYLSDPELEYLEKSFGILSK